MQDEEKYKCITLDKNKTMGVYGYLYNHTKNWIAFYMVAKKDVQYTLNMIADIVGLYYNHDIMTCMQNVLELF